MEEEGRRRGRDPRCLFWISRTHTGVHTDIVRKEKNKLRQSAIKEQSAAETASYCTTVSFALPLRPFVLLCVYGGGAAGVQRGCLLCIIQPSVNTTHKQPVNAPSKDSELPLPLRFSSSTSLHFHQCLHVNVRSSFCIIRATKGTYLL